jgi:plastocyanin
MHAPPIGWIQGYYYMSNTPHLTTRRGFVAALGFGGVSLYGVWVGYGAAPGPSELFNSVESLDDHLTDARAAHDEHGAAASGPDIDAFRREVSDFISRFAQPDGSVHPQRVESTTTDMAMPNSSMAPDAGMQTMDHGQHDTHPIDPAAAMTSIDNAAPIAVPILAERWFYEPAHLRLDAGTSYRFRMMAVDIPHGASIQFGLGARMIRLRPGSVAEVDLTFTRRGSYLVYCTFYCGVGHDAMQARIDVV